MKKHIILWTICLTLSYSVFAGAAFPEGYSYFCKLPTKTYSVYFETDSTCSITVRFLCSKLPEKMQTITMKCKVLRDHSRSAKRAIFYQGTLSVVDSQAFIVSNGTLQFPIIDSTDCFFLTAKGRQSPGIEAGASIKNYPRLPTAYEDLALIPILGDRKVWIKLYKRQMELAWGGVNDGLSFYSNFRLAYLRKKRQSIIESQFRYWPKQWVMHKSNVRVHLSKSGYIRKKTYTKYN